MVQLDEAVAVHGQRGDAIVGVLVSGAKAVDKWMCLAGREPMAAFPTTRHTRMLRIFSLLAGQQATHEVVELSFEIVQYGSIAEISLRYSSGLPDRGGAGFIDAGAASAVEWIGGCA